MKIQKQPNGLLVAYLEAGVHYNYKFNKHTGGNKLKLRRKFKKDLTKCGVCYNFLWGTDVPPQIAIHDACEQHLTWLALRW